MDKKKNIRNLHLSRSKADDLRGFEELLNLVDEDHEVIVKVDKKDDRFLNDYKLYSFLDNERNRLEKLDSLLTKRIPNQLVNNTNKVAYEKQCDHVEDILEEIVPKLMDTAGPLIQRIGTYYNQCFEKNND